MYEPKKTKYRKQMRRFKSHYPVACTGNKMFIGNVALATAEPGLVTSRQLEAGRRVVSRSVKAFGKVYVRLLTDKPITKKPVEQKLGKGKAAVDHWAIHLKTGKIIYEVRATKVDVAITALNKAGFKMPMKTKVISQETNEQKA